MVHSESFDPWCGGHRRGKVAVPACSPISKGRPCGGTLLTVNTLVYFFTVRTGFGHLCVGTKQRTQPTSTTTSPLLPPDLPPGLLLPALLLSLPTCPPSIHLASLPADNSIQPNPPQHQPTNNKHNNKCDAEREHRFLSLSSSLSRWGVDRGRGEGRKRQVLAAAAGGWWPL